MAYAFEQTQGQPWLANAIACECVEEITRFDYTIPITKDLVDQAIQRLVLARGTHFDSMIERLKEKRVRSVIEPLILGDEVVESGSEDYLYTRDLGLIRELGGTAVPANPIYAELIVRALSWDAQRLIGNEHKDYIAPRYLKDGQIDMDFLLRDFQQFWRESSEIWITRYRENFYQYEEAAPHLVLQAFLQRVINAGGQIIREMALGSRRADLCVIYGEHKYPIEIKLLKGAKTIPEGLAQNADYMDKVGESQGSLVIFDRDAGKSWEEKIYMRSETVAGKKITLAGC